MAYDVVNIGALLAAVIGQDSPRELVAPGKAINELVFLDVPGGVSLQLKLGRNNRSFFNVTKGFSMEPRGEEDANSGLYLANSVAQPGITCEVLIVYGDGAQLNPVV
jgi:hypothetical protein